MKKQTIKLVLGVFAFAAALVVLAPLLSIVLLSGKNNITIFVDPTGFKGGFNFHNFVTAWDGPPGGVGMATYFRNSLEVLFVTLCINLGAGVNAAYFSSRLSRAGRTRVRTIFLLAVTIPVILVELPIFEVTDRLGLLSKPWALGFVYGSLSLPTTVLILQAYFIDFPNEMIESGEVDGLSQHGTFRRVVLPASKGPIVAVGLLATIFVWGEAQLGALLLQTPNTQTISVGMLGFVGQYSSNLGAEFAGLTLATIPMLVLYLIVHGRLSQGLGIGATLR